jgi:hypothetical protein
MFFSAAISFVGLQNSVSRLTLVLWSARMTDRLATTRSSLGFEFFHGRALTVYRSPGHQTDGGSIAEIFAGRKATRWLRL